MIRKPHVVIRSVKPVTILEHFAGSHLKNGGLPIPLAHRRGGFDLRAEMNVVPVPFFQSCFQDRGNSILSGAMIQNRWWLLRFIAQVDLNRMPLACPDPGVIVTESKPAFVIRAYDVGQDLPADVKLMFAHAFDQDIHIRPALRVQFDMDRLRLVSQHKAQKLADPFIFFFVDHFCNVLRREQPMLSWGSPLVFKQCFLL